MKKKYIVVTGGAGFVGSNLIEYFLEKTNFTIISIDNYSSGTKKNHLKSKRITYVNGSTKDIASILKNKKKKINSIFHFGEFSRIYQSFLQYDKCIRYNLKGSFEVVTFATKNRIKIIYSATSSMLGNNGKDENLSPYSWSKAKNLELIKNFNKWFGLKYEIVFFYNVYGPGQIKNSNMSAVIGIFETQFKKGRPLTVVKPGSQRRDFTHINDIVRGCYLAWKKGRQSEYMLGTKKQFSILEIARMFKTSIKFIPSRKGERFKSSISNNNAYKHLNYTANIKIEKYINSFILR